MLSATKTCSTGTSWPLKAGPIDYPKMPEWNYHFMLCTIPEDTMSQNMFNFSAFPTGECQMVEYIYICSVTLLQKKSNRVKSHDLPGQGIGPALSTKHPWSRLKTLVSKKHHTWDFHLLIPHKQNPHTEINHLAVTAKILSQPSIQMCVATVAVQLWQTDCHGLHERLPWLVQHSCAIWTQIILWFTRDEKNIPVTLRCSEPVTQPANVSVFSNSRHCSLSACNPTVWL